MRERQKHYMRLAVMLRDEIMCQSDCYEAEKLPPTSAVIDTRLTFHSGQQGYGPVTANTHLVANHNAACYELGLPGGIWAYNQYITEHPLSIGICLAQQLHPKDP